MLISEYAADSSEVAIGSAVLVSDQSVDDPKEERVVAVAKEGATKPQEGEMHSQSPTECSHSQIRHLFLDLSVVVEILFIWHSKIHPFVLCFICSC